MCARFTHMTRDLCKELDHNTFSDAKVIEMASRFTTMKVDLTNYDSPESEKLRKQFRVAGVPTVIFLGSDGTEVADTRVVGFVNAEDFARLGKLALDSRLSAVRVAP